MIARLSQISRIVILPVLFATAVLGAEPARPATGSPGRSLYVNPNTGDDGANGLAEEKKDTNGPVKTIARGIRLAGAGDTVHLAPTVYAETAVFHNRHGEPGRPITLDGHGATLEEADLLKVEDWEKVGPGTYRNDHLIRVDFLTRDDSVVRRWFFLFNGRIVHMGRTMKGPSEPFKKPSDLKPNEWTFVNSEHAFYVCIDPSQSLADARIAAPQRSAAVAISGDCAHIVVRNVVGKHPWNDGYNIHGKSRDLVFENIAAIECGDDGISAHDDCTLTVDGFVSTGNSTGIANVGRSNSTNRRVWIQDCLGVDLLIQDEGYRGTEDTPKQARHSLVDSVILSSASRAVVVEGARSLDGPCRLDLQNVLIRRVIAHGEIWTSQGTTVFADRTTIIGLNIMARGDVTLRGSILTGERAPTITLGAGVAWRADQNRYNLHAIKVDQASYTAKQFAQYQQATGQDKASRWETIAVGAGTSVPSEPGVGADASRLPAQPQK